MKSCKLLEVFKKIKLYAQNKYAQNDRIGMELVSHH